ncbi:MULTISPECIES: stage III sporulation protein SpoIIIAB [unclassified Bacillus (in: firmicutes)]|uniref:stage III sporulation protein SpoIIIAB n=1 Tax=unclassified Bacillus (in: firmicutes) TaxID=185979 RepID=UPI0008E220EB|nr:MULTISPECIES: stage III sporulation protein SpoIIIAB [unclassified Bacillus (in: firmicutes)]SFA96676.1 stage III sporulation protein AB [Bacillus sp. UNCCL13]SFQ79954.1 stage III sporulation protein AB [Bacillus sp. cl95]
MMKLIGAIFIIVATTWTGFEASRHLSERPKQLRMLKSALQSLEAEIMYGHTPLHEASRRLSTQIPRPLSWFFESFAKKLTQTETTVKEAWEESLKEVWRLTALKQGEFEIMKQFGETLGRHDRYSQQKQIMLTLSHLEREEVDARERQAKYEKMVKSLGFLSGLLLIILLI